MKGVGLTEAEAKKRVADIKRLASRIGCANPNMICDPLLSIALGEPSIHPVFLEKWLERRGVYNPDGEESIEECLDRVYGKEWADLAKSLL